MDVERAAAVADAFGLGVVQAVQYAARGAMGEIWRVTSDRGVWAVKALFEWADYPALPEDLSVQHAARAAGIPLPAPVVTDQGAVLAVAGRRYRVYEWVELEPQLAAPATPHRADEAGRLLGQFHALDLPLMDRTVDPWYLTSPTAPEWEHLVGAAEHAGASWATELGANLPRIAALTSSLAPNHGAPSLCHRDFTRANVLPSSKAQRLVVLDWENAGPLAADQELAAALQDWTTSHGRADPASAQAFMAGYRDAGGATQLRGRASFSTLIAATLNFLAVMANQALDDPVNRAFAEDQLDQMLQGLEHLTTSIDALLALSLPRH